MESEEITETIVSEFKVVLDNLAEAFLQADAGEMGPYGFTEKEMINATHIFADVMLDRMWANMKDEEKFGPKGVKLAEEAGDAIAALVLRFTGLDTKTYYGKK